jgi:adhesin/invasin
MLRHRKDLSACIVALFIAAAVWACDTDGRFIATAADITVGARVVIVGGNGQSVFPNTPTAAPFTIQVLDTTGFVVPGLGVAWQIDSGGGALTNITSVTNANGIASTQYTAGPLITTATITATVNGLLPVTFTAFIVAGP